MILLGAFSGAGMNVAVTTSSLLATKLQALVRGHAERLQPTNIEPGAAIAVRLTWELSRTDAIQVDPQLTLPSRLVTVPLPVPFFLTVNRMLPAAGGGTVPVPASPTLCGLPRALLLMEALAVRVPIAVGLNDTLKLQVPFGISVALLQLFGPTT